MLNCFKKLPVSLALAVVISTGGLASADVLRIGGTGSVTEILKHLGVTFTAASEIRVEVISSLGSNGGIAAVADGVIDIAMSGRTLKPGELAKGLTQVLALRTPYGLVTSRHNPNGMRSADVAEVFKIVNPHWVDGEPIRIILRPKSDSDTEFMREIFPGMSAAIEAARLRPDVLVAATDQDNADLAQRVEGSLSGATVTQIKMEKRDLRFVALDGVKPTLENYEKGIYPFGKRLFVIVPEKRGPEVDRFIAFLQSSQGVNALRDAGILVAAEP